MDEADDELALRKWVRLNRTVKWSKAIGDAIVGRVRRGETIASIGRTPGLPQEQTVHRWLREKPAFAQAVDEARKLAGCPLKGAVSTYCEETARAIFERLCNGEGMVAICRDPAMPCASTVRRWRLEHAEFRDAVAFARQVQADLFFERGWKLCEEATPATAYLTRVRLGQLRWAAGKLGPKQYGNLKAAEPQAASGDATAPAAGADGAAGPGGAAAVEAGEAGGAKDGAGKRREPVHVYQRQFDVDPETGKVEDSKLKPPILLHTINPDGTVTWPPAHEMERRKAEAADHDRARREAVRAHKAAGGVFNGGPRAEYWPQWWRDAYPVDFVRLQRKEAAEDRRMAERAAEKAAYLANGGDPAIFGDTVPAQGSGALPGEDWL